MCNGSKSMLSKKKKKNEVWGGYMKDEVRNTYLLILLNEIG